MRRSLTWTRALAIVLALCGGGWLTAQEQPASPDEKATREPVYRISSLPADGEPKTAPAAEVANATGPGINAPAEATTVRHPLDPAIDLAKSRLEAMTRDIKDYQAIMVKRERIDGKLKEHEFAKIKVRNRRDTDVGSVPFSIYMRFLKPKDIKGREVIYVEGRNNGKLIAHDTGLRGIITAHLDPTGPMAMANSRYPIYDAGLDNLVMKLIEKAERDKAAGTCEVVFDENAKINERPCTKITVTHPERVQPFDFNVAEIFIDQELQVPVRYASYSWPRVNGADPELIEEYTYLNLEFNLGLTDHDFDPANKEYRFP